MWITSSEQWHSVANINWKHTICGFMRCFRIHTEIQKVICCAFVSHARKLTIAWIPVAGNIFQVSHCTRGMRYSLRNGDTEIPISASVPARRITARPIFHSRAEFGLKNGHAVILRTCMETQQDPRATILQRISSRVWSALYRNLSELGRLIELKQ